MTFSSLEVTIVMALLTLSRMAGTLRPLWGYLPARFRWLPEYLVAAAAVALQVYPDAVPFERIPALEFVQLLLLAVVPGLPQFEKPKENSGKLLQGMIVLLAALTLFGCAGSFEEARAAGIQRARASQNPPGRDDVRCRKLDARRSTWSGIAAGSIVLAGSSGLTALPVDDQTRTTLAVGALTFSAIAAGAKVAADDAAKAWARECSGAGL